jgi:hypothetical protein
MRTGGICSTRGLRSKLGLSNSSFIKKYESAPLQKVR